MKFEYISYYPYDITFFKTKDKLYFFYEITGVNMYINNQTQTSVHVHTLY